MKILYLFEIFIYHKGRRVFYLLISRKGRRGIIINHNHLNKSACHQV